MSIDTKKTYNKVQHSFMINTFVSLTSELSPAPGRVARTLNASVSLSPLSNSKGKELQLHPKYREVTETE